MALQDEDLPVGTIQDGFRYKGGGRWQESNWEPVEPPGRRLLPRGRATGDRRSEEAYWGRRRTQGDPAVTQAEQGVAASRRAEGLLARQEAQGEGTGGIYGVPVLGAVAGFLDPEIRELNALQARQARLERQPGEGAISDFDAAQFVAMTYGADKPMETNRALIQAQRVINDATLQKREFDEWYFGQYGTTAGSQEAWRVYAQENPIFDPSSQRGEGPARINGERQNWRQYFTGEQGLDTQADIDARSLDGAAALPEFADVRTDQNGLPVYSGPSGSEVSPIPAGADIRRTADGKSYAVVNSENLAPEDTPESLRAAGYQQDADGTWFRMVGSDLPPGDGGGVDGSARPGSGGDARPAPAGGGSAVGMEQVLGGQAAFARSALEQVPFGDELMAGFAGVMSGQGYDRMREAQLALADYDRQNNRFERNMGGVAGATAQIPVGMGVAGMAPRALQMAPRVAGASRMANAGRLATNAVRAGATGGATSAVYGAGAGEGGLAERADDAVQGGVLGAVATPIVGAAARPVINNVLAPAGRVIARPIAALGERFGVPGAAEASRRLAPNVLEGAVDRYGARFNPDAGVLTQRADERAAQGLETTFVDLMDEGQRGLGRALATRQTPARQAVREFAEGRAERLPDRMAMQARRTMSNDPRSPAEIRDQLAASGRREAEPLYREAYARQIEPSPVIDEMLSRPAGRAALQKAYTIARNEGRNPNELGMFVSTREAGSPAASSRLPADPELFADLDAMRAGRRTQGPARGESLLEFISKNGGVRDDGGDLAAIGADAWNRQGAWRSRAVRDDGLSLEQMADRARAAGYFDDVADATADSADNYQRISSQDMARAIDAELRGNPRFARAVGDTDRSANAALRSSRRNALEERLNREGIDISRASNADIARALRDADDAEARAMAFMDGDSPGPQVELIPGETPSMQTLDYVKRGFDDVLEGSRNATGQLVLDTNGRAVQQLRRDYRAELDRLNPAYAAARASHASASQLQRATELGENFLSMEADEFSRQASRLNPAEREVAVAAARRAVERGAGTQGAAPGVAQRLASGREQNMRNAALLENPIPMQDAMRAEREGVMAARAVYPGSGSITSQAVSDQAQAGMNVLSAGANAVTGNVRGTVGALGRLVRLGYSDQEANALMTAAIDPNRTREVIDMLATRMNRQDARSMLRAIRFSAARGAGETAGDDE